MAILANIFVEGKSDAKFLSDYLLYLGLKETVKITPLEGKGKLSKVPLSTIEENKSKGLKSLAIVDTDRSLEDSRNEISKFPVTAMLDAIFHIPNDNDPGMLENVLENIVKSHRFEEFTNCWDGYVTCIEQQPSGFRGPFPKSKIYAYMEAISPKEGNKFKGVDKIDFSDSENWDLDAPYLEPLKQFLTSQLK